MSEGSLSNKSTSSTSVHEALTFGTRVQTLKDTPLVAYNSVQSGVRPSLLRKHTIK